jgi:hypothetical protein
MHNQFPPDSEEYETDERVPGQQECEADEADDESEELHAGSLPRDPLEDTPENEFVLPRISSPEKFYVKLRRQLSAIGVRYEKLTRKTPEGEAPPCFEFADADYDAWLTAASLTSDIPHRYDMPGEPNYCRDCTVQFRHKAILAGKCQFYNVFFEIAHSNGEKEAVGVSRSPSVIPTGYRVYREMVVNVDAIENSLLERKRGRPTTGAHEVKPRNRSKV